MLDERAHISQRKLLLPPFHGERMQGYGQTMTEIAAREIESWPTGVPHKLRPRMQAITLDIILETVFGVMGESDGGASGRPSRVPRPDHEPADVCPAHPFGPPDRRFPWFRRRIEASTG